MMRSLRFIFIALITSLFVTNAVFLRRTVSYSFLGDYGKADAAEPSKDFSVVQKNEQKIAGCFLGVCVNLPKIPVSIPTLPSSPTSSDDNKPSIDLTGTWIGEGYQCPRGTPHDHEIVNIEVSGNSLVATKVDSAGDECVPSSNTTFSATIPNKISKGSSFPVTGVAGLPNNPASQSTPGQLTIINENTLDWSSGTGEHITFNRRIKNENYCDANKSLNKQSTKSINQSKNLAKTLSHWENVKPDVLTRFTLADSNEISPDNSSNNGISVQMGIKVANEAEKVANDYIQRMVKYKYGADASNGGTTSDCSHFVHNVLNLAGIKLKNPLTAATIRKNSDFIKIPAEKAQAGDIMSQLNPPHINVYTGESDNNGCPLGWEMGGGGAKKAPWGKNGWFRGGDDLQYYRPIKR